MTTEAQIDPLEHPALAGPTLEASPPPAAPAVKKTWRQKRWERRRRRVLFEEALSWILVPVILFGVYWAIDGALNALGTSPSAIINGISAITAGL